MIGQIAEAAAREANRRTYEDAQTTLSYVDARYHAVRRQILGDTLIAALDRLPKASTGGALLEIGSGAATILDSLPDVGLPTVVADQSWSALTTLKRSQHRLVQLDVTDMLPLADESVTAVVAGELIEHVFYPDRLLGEILRVLRPGGVLVLSTPNLATLFDRIRFLAGRSPRQVDPLHPYLRLHISPFTAHKLRTALRSAGFTRVSVRSNHVGFPVGHGRWLQSRWLARLFPSLGGSLVVRAHRPPPI